VVNRPPSYNSYEFVVVASLRAKQLLAGCTPHVEGDHNAAITAQMEVADATSVRCGDDVPAAASVSGSYKRQRFERK
jgi:hypothetical protein